jgi:uncharacterized radical SAM protein YgiQ
MDMVRPHEHSMSASSQKPSSLLPLPMTREEVAARGWDAVDVVFVTGDAYVDHPSFAMALLGRVLESEGYRVAILSQPDWRSCGPWRTFGRPRLCFAVSAGNMDSMLNHYTAARKVRNDDAYSPGGKIGRRPDRATLAYCQRAREAYRGVPIIAGGVEASLRRLAHYDYWSDKVRRSILMDAKADLLVYGMGEKPLVEIVRRLAAGEPVGQIRDVRGTVYRLGAREARIVEREASPSGGQPQPTDQEPQTTTRVPQAAILPSYEEVATDRRAFAAMTLAIYRETNPYNARRLVQRDGREAVVVNPPAMPLGEAEMDRIYGLPFSRRPHPGYGRQRIPAYEVVKDSIQIVRGCFGGCAFCSLTAHQGRAIQGRSRQSVLEEIRRMAADPDFSGVVSDIGGPTANMYGMDCGSPETRHKCRRPSCLHPTICKLLVTDHGPLVELLREARRQKGVRQVLVASGVRMDLAQRSAAYIRELAQHHTGGLLKVAPEHTDPEVLRLMKKPRIEEFEAFERTFRQAAADAGKEQYLAPYFMAGHPGCDLRAMIGLALFLKRTGYRPDKVQDFIPLPMDLATCMYYTAMDPLTGEPIHVPKGAHERRLQRALLQFWKPENDADVRKALEQAGREDLIGAGAECLIPSRPPRGASGPKQASQTQVTRPSRGYRPHRPTSKRRAKKNS